MTCPRERAGGGAPDRTAFAITDVKPGDRLHKYRRRNQSLSPRTATEAPVQVRPAKPLARRARESKLFGRFDASDEQEEQGPQRPTTWRRLHWLGGNVAPWRKLYRPLIIEADRKRSDDVRKSAKSRLSVGARGRQKMDEPVHFLRRCGKLAG